MAVVGAGPRGTSVLERLCASAPELTPDTPLTIHLVDPAPPGPGRVWRTDQSAELLMNTVASQVTLFTDDSVACEGPIRSGPSLYEWATGIAGETVGPDDYPTRACYGRYLEWAFNRAVASAPKSVTVEVHRARAVRLEDDRERPAGNGARVAAASAWARPEAWATGSEAETRTTQAFPGSRPHVQVTASGAQSAAARAFPETQGFPEAQAFPETQAAASGAEAGAGRPRPEARATTSGSRPHAQATASGAQSAARVPRPRASGDAAAAPEASTLDAVGGLKAAAPGAPGPEVAAPGGLAPAATGPGAATAPLQTLTLDDGTTITGLSAVILAQGHLPVVSRQTQAHLAEYAARHPRLRYFRPANPADLDLSPIAPGESVLLRGLGLNFFDHMALLTTGRGGAYVRGDDGALTYLPSGREPRLYAGSRRGVPYQARGDNAKGASGRHEPLLLTPDVIAVFRKRADEGDPPDFLTEIWPLVAKEVETVHYEALLAAREPGPDGPVPRGFRTRYLDSPHGSPQETAVLDEFGIAHSDRWSWDRISRPYADERFASPAEHRDWLLAHLRQDAAAAALGNVAGPLKAALDVLRDLRNELRLIVDHSGLSGTSRRDHLDRWYTPLNAFLSIGPPRRRIEEMTALIEAGVLDVIGPRTTIGMSHEILEGAFTAESPDVPGSFVTATTLIEARLPDPDLRRTRDELLGRLLKAGQCRPHTIDGYETGGLDVTQRPYRLINRQGRPNFRRFAIGVPTEGVHWVTAAGARPGVDSVALSDADAVARAALRTLGTSPRNTEAEPVAEIDRRPTVELASID
ncbi:FAD/NAD(P)-binding protein [Streptomyces sp. NPDC001820]|uniref:FAD/NAD(P)-binding protein n=1 Tax=Streptomyces sp. NPDC001820 TaxID=3364613 RepID=UPI0036812DC7